MTRRSSKQFVEQSACASAKGTKGSTLCGSCTVGDGKRQFHGGLERVARRRLRWSRCSQEHTSQPPLRRVPFVQPCTRSCVGLCRESGYILYRSATSKDERGLTRPTHLARHINLAPLVDKFERWLVPNHVHATTMLVEHILQTDIAVVTSDETKCRRKRNSSGQVDREVSLPALLPLLQYRIENPEQLCQSLFPSTMPPRR